MTAPRQSVATQSGREYVDPTTGRHYPSVTRILNIIDKPLKNWAAKVTAEYAVDNAPAWQQLDRDAAIDLIKREALRYTGRKADIGTAVHAACETYADGHLFNPDEYDPAIAPYLTQFRRFLNDWNPTYRYLEATIYSDTHGYAGTLDAIADLPNIGTIIIDLKTGKDIYDEAALQLAGYANAERIVTGDPENGIPWLSEPMPIINAGYVLHLGPRSYRFRPVECGPDIHDAFICAAALAHFRDTRYGTLIHHPLVAPNRPSGDDSGADDTPIVSVGPGDDVSKTDAASQPDAPVPTVGGSAVGTSSPYHEQRAQLRARLEAFPTDELTKAKQGWKRHRLPTLTKPDRWTDELITQAATLITEAEIHIAYERGVALKICAIRARELGLDDDTRHQLVGQLTDGRRAGLKDCDLTDLRTIQHHFDTLKTEREGATA